MIKASLKISVKGSLCYTSPILSVLSRVNLYRKALRFIDNTVDFELRCMMVCARAYTFTIWSYVGNELTHPIEWSHWKQISILRYGLFSFNGYGFLLDAGSFFCSAVSAVLICCLNKCAVMVVHPSPPMSAIFSWHHHPCQEMAYFIPFHCAAFKHSNTLVFRLSSTMPSMHLQYERPCRISFRLR